MINTILENTCLANKKRWTIKELLCPYCSLFGYERSSFFFKWKIINFFLDRGVSDQGFKLDGNGYLFSIGSMGLYYWYIVKYILVQIKTFIFKIGRKTNSKIMEE